MPNEFVSPFGKDESLSSSSRRVKDPSIPRRRFMEYLSDEGRALETAGPLLSSATQQFYRDLDVDRRRKTLAKGERGGGGPSPSMLNARTIHCTDVSRVARREAAIAAASQQPQSSAPNTPPAATLATVSRLASSLLRNAKFGIIAENVLNRPFEPFDSNPFVSYAGDMAEGECHGQGLLVCQDGSSIRGRFVHGELTGNGIRTSADGSVYEGGFFKGEMHGDNGVENCVEKGEYYTGSFQYNLREGRGTLITSVKPPRAPETKMGANSSTITNTTVNPATVSTHTSTTHPHQGDVAPLGKRVGTRTAYSGLFAKGFPQDDNGLLVVMGESATVGGFHRGLPEGRGCTVYFPRNAPRLAVSSRHRSVPHAVVEDLRALLDERGWVYRTLGGVAIRIPPAPSLSSNVDSDSNNHSDLPLSRELYVGSYHNGLEDDLRGIMVSNQWFQADGADAPFQLTSSGVDFGSDGDATIGSDDTQRKAHDRELCLAYVGPFSGGARVSVPSLSVPRAVTITPPAGCGPDGALPGGSARPPPSGRVGAILPDPIPSLAGRYGHPLPLSEYLEKYHPAASGSPTNSIKYHLSHLPDATANTTTTTTDTTTDTPVAKRSVLASSRVPGDSPRRVGGGSLNMSVRSQVSAVISFTRPLPTPMGWGVGSRLGGASKAASHENNHRTVAHVLSPYADVFIPVTAGSVLDITLGLGGLSSPSGGGGDLKLGVSSSVHDVVMDPYHAYVTTPSTHSNSPTRVGTRPSGHRPTSETTKSSISKHGKSEGTDEPPPPPFSHPAARLMAAVGSGIVEMDVFETNRRLKTSLLRVPEGMDPYAVTPSNCDGIIPIIEPGGNDITGREIVELDIAKHIAAFYEAAQETTGNKSNVCDLDAMAATVASLAKGGKGGREVGGRDGDSRRSVMMSRGSTMPRSSVGSSVFSGGLLSPSAIGKPLQAPNSRRSSLGSASASDAMLGAGAQITRSTANVLTTSSAMSTKAINGVAAMFDENAPLTVSPLITTDAIHTTIRVPLETPTPSTPVQDTQKPKRVGKTPLEELVYSAQELGKLYVDSVASGLKKHPGSAANTSRSMGSSTRRAVDLAPLTLATSLKRDAKQPSSSLSPRAKLPPHATIRCVIPPTSHIGLSLYVLYISPVDPSVQLRPGEVPPQQLANPGIAYGDQYDYGERPPPQYLQDQLSYLDAQMAATRAEIQSLVIGAPPTSNLVAPVRRGGGSKGTRSTRVTLDLPQEERYGLNSDNSNATDRITTLEASLLSLKEAKDALLEEVARPLRTPLGLIRPFILPIRITHPTKPQQSAIATHVESWAASARGKSCTRSEDAATTVAGGGEDDLSEDEDGEDTDSQSTLR